MSDNNKTVEGNGRDEAILEIVDRLARSEGSAGETPLDDSAGETCSWLETLSLLPYGLEEEPVRSEVKKRLMSQVGATAEVTQVPREYEVPTSGSRTRYLQIAAMLAIAIGFLVFQRAQVAETRRLTAEMRQMVESSGAERRELVELRRRLADNREQLAMVTARGAEFCVLKPVDGATTAATATMVISNDRKSWYMAAEGLSPCGGEACYDLWFHTEGGPIHGASFEPGEALERIELTGESEILSTPLSGISITRAGQSEDGERVLFADQATMIL